MLLMKYQLEQQSKQAQAALDHIQLLKDQLDAESAARYKAQAQCHHLLKQNKDLLDHVQSLFKQIQELENFVVKLQHKLPMSDSQLVSRTTNSSNLGMSQGKIHPMIADGSVLHYNAAYLCNGSSVIKSQNPHSTANPTDKSIKHENILLKIEDSYPIASDHVESTPQKKCMETNSSQLKSKFSVQVKCTTGNVVPNNVSTSLTYKTAAARNTLPIYSSVSKITNGSTTHFSNYLSDRYNGNTFKADKPLVIEEIAEPGSKSTSKHEFIESSPASVSTLQLSGEQPYSKLYSGYPKSLKSYFNDYIPKPLHGPELSNEEREKALKQLQSMAQW